MEKMQNVGVQHEGPQAHLGLELQPNGMAHDPNPFIRGQALGPSLMPTQSLLGE